MSGLCATCGGVASAMCACMHVSYCGHACQKADWSTHRNWCPARVAIADPKPAAGEVDRTATRLLGDLVDDLPRLLRAIDSMCESLCMRDPQRDWSPLAKKYAAWEESLSRQLETNRPNGNFRWQLEVLLVGPSLLTVRNTARYEALVQAAMHPVHGVPALRKSRNVPLTMPAMFQPPSGDAVLNDFIRYVYEFHALMVDPDDDEFPMLPAMPHSLLTHGISEANMIEFATHVHNTWDGFALPMPRIDVQTLQPVGNPGDVIGWRATHGSAAVFGRASPHAVMFLDVAPRDVFEPSTRDVLYQIQLTRPIDIGGGAKATRHEGWNRRYNQAQGLTGGLALLPPTADADLAHYLAGSDGREAAALNKLPPNVLSPAQVAQANADGFFVLPAATFGPAWAEAVQRVIGEFEAYMNWVLFVQQGRPERLLFSRPDAMQWSALSGIGTEVRRHYGDPTLFRIPNRHGERSKTAQFGGTFLTGQQGMGAAANAYDLPAQQELRSNPMLVSALAQLHGTPRLLTIPERFRIKVAAAQFEQHSDMVAPLPIGWS